MATKLTPYEEQQKREIYDKLSPRRRKFIDKIGYEEWDPFCKPKDPIEMRTDPTNRTTQQLVREYLQGANARTYNGSPVYAQGVLEAALGVINNNDDRIRGMYDFITWYNELLKKEGINTDE